MSTQTQHTQEADFVRWQGFLEDKSLPEGDDASLDGNACDLQARTVTLPESHLPFTDKYFERTAEILQRENINPWVRAQVFIRQGPGELRGIEEARAIINRYTPLTEHGGKISALPEGARYEAGESVMLIEGPIQDIVELETMYLGVISAETTKANDATAAVDLAKVSERAHQIVEASEGRPLIYMGARHWRFDQDRAISAAAFDGGATDCTTDIGASTVGKTGMGTIPHALQNAYAYIYGKERAVVESVLAFDRVIDKTVPRIALVDYNNHEIDDALASAHALGHKLFGVRVDTCGENIPQGGLTGPHEGSHGIWQGVKLPALDHPDAKYWYGRGVTITAIYALRCALNQAGFEDLKIVLSSGFGKLEKVKAFARAEKALNLKLFDILGVGGLFEARYATMDIVAVGESPDNMRALSKVGREYRANLRLGEIV